MILHPAIIALVVSSILISLLALYSAWYAALILRKWDLASGNGLQLELERRTYLVSTILSCVLGFQIVSLLLYVHTADKISSLFTGAMCAAGTLHVNSYGYPVLILKILNALLAVLWLILNYTDNQAYDYPLIRRKYSFLLVMAPLLLVEAVLQVRFFLGLKPELITSCCGSLFSSGGTTSDLTAFNPSFMKVVFGISMVLTAASGGFSLVLGKGVRLFSFLAAATLCVAPASVISFIAPYIYELPNHHCPFCILQGEYHYVGYPLYLTMLGASAAGMGAGVIEPFKNIASLSGVVGPLQRRLTLLSMALFALFFLMVLVSIGSSNLVL